MGQAGPFAGLTLHPRREHLPFDDALKRIELFLRVPSLRRRAWEVLESSRALMIDALNHDSANDPFRTRVAVAACLVAFMEAAERWAGGGGRESIEELINLALDELAEGCR